MTLNDVPSEYMHIMKHAARIKRGAEAVKAIGTVFSFCADEAEKGSMKGLDWSELGAVFTFFGEVFIESADAAYDSAESLDMNVIKNQHGGQA